MDEPKHSWLPDQPQPSQHSLLYDYSQSSTWTMDFEGQLSDVQVSNALPQYGIESTDAMDLFIDIHPQPLQPGRNHDRSFPNDATTPQNGYQVQSNINTVTPLAYLDTTHPSTATHLSQNFLHKEDYNRRLHNTTSQDPSYEYTVTPQNGYQIQGDINTVTPRAYPDAMDLLRDVHPPPQYSPQPLQLGRNHDRSFPNDTTQDLSSQYTVASQNGHQVQSDINAMTPLAYIDTMHLSPPQTFHRTQDDDNTSRDVVLLGSPFQYPKVPHNNSRVQGDINDVSWLNLDLDLPDTQGPLQSIPSTEPPQAWQDEVISLRGEIGQLRNEIAHLRTYSVPAAMADRELRNEVESLRSRHIPVLADYICEFVEWAKSRVTCENCSSEQRVTVNDSDADDGEMEDRESHDERSPI